MRPPFSLSCATASPTRKELRAKEIWTGAQKCGRLKKRAGNGGMQVLGEKTPHLSREGGIV